MTMRNKQVETSIEGNVYIDASLFNSKKPIYNLIQKNNEIELIFYFDRRKRIDLYVVVKRLVKPSFDKYTQRDPFIH